MAKGQLELVRRLGWGASRLRAQSGSKRALCTALTTTRVSGFSRSPADSPASHGWLREEERKLVEVTEGAG